MNGSYPEKKARATKNISMPIQFLNYKMDQRLLININPLHMLPSSTNLVGFTLSYHYVIMKPQ